MTSFHPQMRKGIVTITIFGYIVIMALHKCRKMLMLCFFVYTIIGGIDPVFGTHMTSLGVNNYADFGGVTENLIEKESSFFVSEGDTLTFTCKSTKINAATNQPFSITWELGGNEITSSSDSIPDGPAWINFPHDDDELGAGYYTFVSGYTTAITITSDHNNKLLSCQIKYDGDVDPADISEITLKVCSVGTEPCSDQSNCAVMCDNTNDCDDLKDEADCGQGPGEESSDSGDTSSNSGDNSSDSGDNSSDSGDNSSDSGDNSSDSGDNNSDSGDNSSDSGDTSSNSGDTSSDSGE